MLHSVVVHAACLGRAIQLCFDNQSSSLCRCSFFTIREVLKLYPALALRLFLLSTQYRQAVNYTQRALEEVQPYHADIRINKAQSVWR